ncbi:DUF1090 family protein [Tatumella sp. UBA2305]|uniref:DUF1090 family protein n=1 Tax=Tatumella sp. UBA2305 TaxID=1947647 RepID=UPI0025F59824|nr:DUF1090 family protein [Tatumella sp. UBA2305]
MKIMVLLIYILMMLSATAEAKGNRCPPQYREKVAAIEHEIALAQRHHNQRRINGLKRALSELQNSCSDNEVSRKQHP